MITADDPTPPIPTLPPSPTQIIPTLPPEPTQVATPTPTSSSIEVPTEFLNLPTWVWIAAGLALILLIVLIVALSKAGGNRSKWDKSFTLRQADARWFADSLTLAVVDRTKSPAEIVSVWSDGAPRITTLSQQLYGLASMAPTDARAYKTRQLANAVDNLHQAVDADVRMRTNGFAPGQDALIAESGTVVAGRRNELLATLAAR